MLKPNFFVALRLSGTSLRDTVEAMQASILSVKPDLSRCMTSSKKMHFTLFVLYLKDDDAIESAKGCLSELRPIIDSFFSARHKFELSCLQLFGKNVVYLCPQKSDSTAALEELAYTVRDSFIRNGIIPVVESDSKSSTFKVVLHATIAKTSADRKNGRKLRIERDDIAVAETFISDLCLLPENGSMDLLKMNEMADDGYYKSYWNA